MTAYELHKHIESLEAIHYQMHNVERNLERQNNYMAHQLNLVPTKSFLFITQHACQENIDKSKDKLRVLSDIAISLTEKILVKK